MNKEWKNDAFKVGEEWSNEALTNQVKSMSKNSNSLNPFEKKGCKINHLLMSHVVDFDHFVLPVLLGLVIDIIYKNLLAKLQAGYEVYTDEYVELVERAQMIAVKLAIRTPRMRRQNISNCMVII
jgi:hypothetical protein